MNFRKKTSKEQESAIVKMYLSGSTAKATAIEFSCATGTVLRVLQSAGIQIRPGKGTSSRIDVDRVAFAELYKRGAGTGILQQKFGLGQSVVYRILRELGLPIRTASEAQRLRMARMTVEERLALAERMSKVNKGRKISQADGIARALGVEAAQNLSDHERNAQQRFLSAGIEMRGHLAIHRYNLDLAHLPSKTAVEVNPNYHSLPKTAALDAAKREYLIYNNWVVHYVMPHRLDNFTIESIAVLCRWRQDNIHNSDFG